jgi:hypothetical protein
VTNWTVGDCALFGGSGWFSDPLTSYSGEPQYSSEVLRIDGHDAKLIRFRSSADAQVSFDAAIRIASNEDADGATSFYAKCRSAQGQTTAVDIFTTIQLD